MRAGWSSSLLLMLACSGTEPSERVVGVIITGPVASDVIVAPDTVEADTRFVAVINTFCSSSCTNPDGVDLNLTSASATITPYDRVPNDQSSTGCTRDMAPRPHPVDLQFATTGTKTIVVQGRLASGVVPGQATATVSKSLVVIPRRTR